MHILLWAAILGIIPALIVKSKSKSESFIGWWLYGALIFIVALPHAILWKPKKEDIDAQKIEEGMKKCPFCGEAVTETAKFCLSCGKDLTNITKALDTEWQETPNYQAGQINKHEGKDVCDVSEPALMNEPSQEALTAQHNDSEKTSTKNSPSAIAIVGLVFGVINLFVPYFASIFFVPITLACGIISIYKGEKKIGIAVTALGIFGVIWIIHVSNKIASIFN
jgi:hypothetical protein